MQLGEWKLKGMNRELRILFAVDVHSYTIKKIKVYHMYVHSILFICIVYLYINIFIVYYIS